MTQDEFNKLYTINHKDFKTADLSHLNLSYRVFRDADFSEAICNNTLLYKTQFSNCILSEELASSLDDNYVSNCWVVIKYVNIAWGTNE